MLEFQNFVNVLSTPKNLIVGISAALGTKKRSFSSENVFWENTVESLTNGECYSSQTLAIVFSMPENLLVGISGALGMKESHFLSKKVIFKNAVGYLRNGEC